MRAIGARAVRRCWAILLLVVCVPGFGATIYRDVVVSGEDEDETTTLSLVKSDGRQIRAPMLEGQAAFSRVGIRQDGRLAVWIALSAWQPGGPSTLAIVVFQNDRIEHVIRDECCIFGWDFARGGTAIAYVRGMRHFSDARFLFLRDIASGRELARYEIPDSSLGPAEPPDSNLAARNKAIADAPDWARNFVD